MKNNSGDDVESPSDADNNPFSFKAFLSSVGNSNAKSQSATANLQSLSSLSENCSSKNVSEKLATNSFSFKQFLNESNKAPTLNGNKSSAFVLQEDLLPELLSEHLPPVISPSNHCDLLSNTDLPFTTNFQLPDFVNETIALDKLSENVNHDSDPYIFLDNIAISNKEKGSEINERSYFDLEPKLPFVSNTKSSTLTSINNLDMVQQKKPNISSVDILSTGESEIFSLAVKAQYDNWLNEKQAKIDEQVIEIKTLRKQLSELKAKEEQENSALEQIIFQIEGNLEKTTKRAIEAEMVVEKLKSENKQLKDKNHTLSNKNKELLELKLNDEDKEARAKTCEDISNGLRTSANAAEGFLQQLMNGVNSLRLIADNIESFDKIHEVKD